jgi:hypothetical protein
MPSVPEGRRKIDPTRLGETSMDLLWPRWSYSEGLKVFCESENQRKGKDRMKMFPILIGYGGTEGPCPSSIPWDAIAPYEGHAQANHQQSLERLAERGGLSPEEALYVMTGKRWRGETFTKEFRREACAFLDKLVRDRGELQAAHDRYKAALEKILNIRLQDKQVADAFREAREVAFAAFDDSTEK